MAYINTTDDEIGQRLSGCGSGCGCRSCSSRFGFGFGERYIPDDEPEEAPAQRGNNEPGERPAQPAEPRGPREQQTPREPPPSTSPPPGAPELTRRGARRRGRMAAAPVAAPMQEPGRTGGFAYGRSLPARGGSPLGNLAWDTQYLPIARLEGHEVLTRDAFGPRDPLGNCNIPFVVRGAPTTRTLTPLEQGLIIEGNKDTDIQYLRRRGLVRGAPAHVLFTLLPGEQKHHALRSTYIQSQTAALADIVGDLRAQHRDIVGDPNPRSQLGKIGKALHLIQDSFSLAHATRRPGAAWCVDYVRNYGPANWSPVSQARRIFGTSEHGIPTDERDHINDRTGRRPEAAQATSASRRYLQIVFKAIYGRTRRDPAVEHEAEVELDRFIADVFRKC